MNDPSYGADPDGVIARLQASVERHRVDHGGRSVCWRGLGSGSPLVLLHGGHGNWLHWVRNLEALARRHRVWVPDLPGFGTSDALDGSPHAPDRMDRLLDAVGGTLDRLVGASAPLGVVGFSFGGLVAAHLAVRRSAVERLALLGPGGHASRRPRFVALADWRVSDPAARGAALRQNLESFMLHDAASADALALAVHAQACVATRFRSKALSIAGGLQAELDRARRPLLAVWGAHDVTCVPDELGPALCAGRHERTFVVVDGAGHWVQYERADEVNRLLLDWFSGGAGS